MQAHTASSQREPGQLVQERLNDLLARSASDLDFRGKLLANPRQAVSEFFGVELPASFSIAVVESKADETFILPDAIDPQAEISERELEAVAGGCTPLTIASAYLGVAASVSAAVASVMDLVNTLDKYSSCQNS
jgi:hypothetical protein